MKFNSLEAFRGIAAVFVVLFHSSFFASLEPNQFIRNGEIFVDFFFILSGFVMAFAYGDRIGRSVGLARFALLRFGRLYPLHLFMLLAWLPYILIKGYLYHKGIGQTDPFAANNLSTFASNALLIHSLGLHAELNWNYPSWSISVELATYFVFYAFMSGIVRGALPANRVLPLAALVSGLAYGYLLWRGESILRTFDLGVVRCIGGFFAGVAVYQLHRAGLKMPSSRALATLIEVLLIALAVYLISRCHGSNLFKMLSIGSFCLVILLFAGQQRGLVSRLLGLRLFQRVGELSYSIYMTHALLLAGLDNVFVYLLKFPSQSLENAGIPKLILVEHSYLINALVVVFIIGVSSLTFEHIEKPWRERFRRLADCWRESPGPCPQPNDRKIAS